MSGSGAGTYLDRIVADVRARLDAAGMAGAPAPAAGVDRAAVSLRDAILAAGAAGELAVIAEVKRRSPSVGAIALDADPAAQGAAYAGAGAAGISVLTERDHFGGSLDDLRDVRTAAPRTAVLRKDFVLEAGQLDEARAAGADAALLIAALHDMDALASLIQHARSLQLDALVEVHDERELERAVEAGAVLVGINNRDLRSFEVDLAVSERIAPLVPPGCLVVAESGVRTVADAARLRAAGVHALLVGEALMRAADPGALLREFATAAPTGRDGGPS